MQAGPQVSGGHGPVRRIARQQRFGARHVGLGVFAEQLLEGGADLILIETVFDTLNAKAALFAVEEVGARLATAGFWVVTGGLGGVMEAASRGAKSRRGHTVGVLPGGDPAAADDRILRLPVV